MKIPTTKISFNSEALKRLGYTKEQFINEFSKVYPDADLNAYAEEMGLISGPSVKSTAAASVPPTAKNTTNPIGKAEIPPAEETKKTEGGK